MLKLLVDGPTLQQLAEKISQELREETSSRSVGEVLVALQNRGYVFLDEGRWWRTPEGISLLDKLSAEVTEQERHVGKTRSNKLLDLAKSAGAPRDLVFAIIISLAVLSLKLSYAFAYLLPGWDPTAYLLNARRFLYGYDPFLYFELLRPPLLPFTIALVWRVFGENYLTAACIQPIFTVLAGLVLYIVTREMFDWRTGMLSLILFLFNPEVFKNTNPVLTHGVGLFFTMLCIFFAWKTNSETVTASSYRQYAYAILIGFLAALTSLTRYPAIVFFPAVLVLVLRRNITWDLKWIIICGFSFIVTWIPWLQWNMINAYGDPFASVRGGYAVVSYQPENAPWYIYLTSLPELVSLFGAALLLVGIASRGVLNDRKRLSFLCWFFVAVAVFATFPVRGLRFAIEWFPAIAVLMSLGARRVQKSLSFKPRVVFNLLLALWMIFLLWGSNIQALGDLSFTSSGNHERELPMIALWITANTAKEEIGATDAYTPQFNYLCRRLIYGLDYIEYESKARGILPREFIFKLNVTFVVGRAEYFEPKSLGLADYLVVLKTFQFSTVYAVVKKATTRHQGVLLVGDYARSSSITPMLLLARQAIEKTIGATIPRFETIDSSKFFAKVEDSYAEDGRPEYALIILLDELWNETSRTLSLGANQLSALKKLIEEHGVALLTSGRASQGWLSQIRQINPNGTSVFTGFHIAASRNIGDWQNLFGNERTWNVNVPSQFLTYRVPPSGLEAIVTTAESDQKALVWAGYLGRGRIVHFCCSVSDLSFDRQMITVNPILIRALFWLLGDYPRVLKGTGFKVSLRIDDVYGGMYSSIENHASALLDRRGVPLSLGVVPKDLPVPATARALLLRLKERGCELLLHGVPGHDDVRKSENQTQSIVEGKELFRDLLGFYPVIFDPPYYSYDYETVKAAEILGFKAITGASVEYRPPGTRGNHFGYPYSNSTVVMLPILPALDYGPFGGWAPSREIAIARTKWLLSSQRYLLGGCVVTLHLNDTRLPDIGSLVDWAKSIGAEFVTLEQMLADTFMSPTLEQYSPYADMSSFADFDILENGYKISFTLTQSVKLRIDIGTEIVYYKVDGKVLKTKGQMIVTEILETGKEHTILVQT